MARVDMHVHSSYSDHPSEWFLQRLGARESYTRPETIISEAQRRGMDFITVTDHNRIDGALQLQELYPERVFTGVEVTTYFPVNGCKIHVLVYGLSERQFAEIDTLRSDIYDLRAYLQQENLAHAVAHATYAINKRLTLPLVEQLILLFDYFECINGSRSMVSNDVLARVLHSLTPSHIEDLRRKHRIEPFSDSAWVKGMIGGTDDHSGLFIGQTYTEADAATPEAFLQRLRAKHTRPGGRHNDYRGLALALYKIAYDFSRTRGNALQSSLLGGLNRIIFETPHLSFKDRITLKRMRMMRGGKVESIAPLVADLVDILRRREGESIDVTLRKSYDCVSAIADRLLKLLLVEVERTMQAGDLMGLAQRISGALPAVFVSLPFFTTMNVLHESRRLLDEMTQRFAPHDKEIPRRVLVFADSEHNAAALLESVRDEVPAGSDLLLAGCFAAGDEPAGCDCVSLPVVHTITPAGLNQTALCVPSVLDGIRLISEANPDEIIVASALPVGLMGLLAARLLHVPCRALYCEAACVAADNRSVQPVLAGYLRWFYTQTDCVLVRGQEERDRLLSQGYDGAKVSCLSASCPAAAGF